MTIPYIKRVLAEELNREQCMLDTIDRFSRHLPEGHLNIKQGKNGPIFQHSMMHEGKRTRVTIDPDWDGAEKLIRELANKSVIQHSKPILKSNIACIRKALSSISSTQQIVLADKPFYQYASPALFMDGIADLNAWAAQEYPPDPRYEKYLKFETKKGHLVRSKSESMIANTVYEYSLLYLYEYPLFLEDVMYRPDFQIIRPSDRALVIWEHFGALDQPGYEGNALKKIKNYQEAGFRLGDTFHYTFETKKDPLTYGKIKAVIRRIHNP